MPSSRRRYGAIDPPRIDGQAPAPPPTGEATHSLSRRLLAARSRKQSAGNLEAQSADGGILFTGSLPGTWTKYINFTATGNQPWLQHPALTLEADGDGSFTGSLDLSPAGIGGVTDSFIILRDSDVAHGMTDEAETDVIGALAGESSLEGGLRIVGFNDVAATVAALVLEGTHGGTPDAATRPAVEFIAFKKSGTGRVALAAAEFAFVWSTDTTDLLYLLGDGRLQGVNGGATTPTYSFINSNQTGFYFTGSALAASLIGVQKLSLGSTTTTFINDNVQFSSVRSVAFIGDSGQDIAARFQANTGRVTLIEFAEGASEHAVLTHTPSTDDLIIKLGDGASSSGEVARFSGGDAAGGLHIGTTFTAPPAQGILTEGNAIFGGTLAWGGGATLGSSDDIPDVTTAETVSGAWTWTTDLLFTNGAGIIATSAVGTLWRVTDTDNGTGLAIEGRSNDAVSAFTENDALFLTLGGFGSDDDGATYDEAVALRMLSAQAWTASAHGSEMEFHTTAIGSAILTLRWILNPAGHWIPAVDGTYDIGLTGTRVRHVYSDNFTGAGPGLTGLDANNISTGTLATAQGGMNIAVGSPGGVLEAVMIVDSSGNFTRLDVTDGGGDLFLKWNDSINALVFETGSVGSHAYDSSVHTGHLGVENGGTGRAGGFLELNSLVISGTGAATDFQQIGGGTSGHFLKSGGEDVAPAFAAITATEVAAGIFPTGNYTFNNGLIEIKRSSNEVLRLLHTSATGSPFLSFHQDSTRLSYIQHVDSNDVLTIVAEYGDIELWTGTGGTEIIRIRIQDTGRVRFGDGGTTNIAQAYSAMRNIGDRSSATTVNWDQSNSQRVNMTGAVEFSFSNMQEGGWYTLSISTNSTPRTPTFSGVSFGDGGAPGQIAGLESLQLAFHLVNAQLRGFICDTGFPSP